MIPFDVDAATTLDQNEDLLVSATFFKCLHLKRMRCLYRSIHGGAGKF